MCGVVWCVCVRAGGPADHIYIKNRKGFVAVAVEEGVDIVSGWLRALAGGVLGTSSSSSSSSASWVVI